jgi:phospholipase A1
MRISLAWLLALSALPAGVLAQDAVGHPVHDPCGTRCSIIANLLQDHDNPFTVSL